jgi:hypothetical protein
VERATERTALRRSTAWRLRRLADRMDPRPHQAQHPPPSAAPLVRFGGRWWPRDALPARVEEPE